MEENEEKKPKTKKPLDLDWAQVLPQNDDDPPPTLLIVKKGKNPFPPAAAAATMYGGDQVTQRDDIVLMREDELENHIKRQKDTLGKMGHRLPDKGEKLRANIRALEEESRRRRHRSSSLPCPAERDVAELEKPAQSINLGPSRCSREESQSSVAHPESQFASIFSKKMDENTNCKVGNAFDEELAIVGDCNSHSKSPTESLSPRRRKKGRGPSRDWPFLHSHRFSFNLDEDDPSKNDQRGRASSNHHFNVSRESFYGSFIEKKDTCQALHKNISRIREKKGQTVVLVDEDEIQLVETTKESDNIPECMKDLTICYPSRDDPESVEIVYLDITCLEPEGYLTSSIMNFYLRYLQLHGSPIDNALGDYHFFNTFFYKKLKQALSYKGSDKESFFVKFRRWWKGINIFEKAYVLIPIHEDLHWSLVIVCIPDKEDECGPIILHLDSLGLHCSKSVFSNIKSYLIKEWNFINQDMFPLDLPISDRIWKHLPRRIEERTISVPQQKNDYDCGLFVLFFIERFIEDAPERLRKKDLSMFGKQWFRPEEASGLRVKIRTLLENEFQKSCQDSRTEESSCLYPEDDASL